MFYTVAGIVFIAIILIGLIGSLILISLDRVCMRLKDASIIALVVFLIMLMTGMIVASVDDYPSSNTDTTYTSIETLDQTKTGVLIIGLYATKLDSFYIVNTRENVLSRKKCPIYYTAIVSSNKYDTPFLLTKTFTIKNRLVRAIKLDKKSFQHVLYVPENYTVQQVKEL